MECAICLGNPVQPFVVPCCKKTYCLECLSQWNQIKNTCPLCCQMSGDKLVNKLPIASEFDDGFVMLETQLKDLKQRINHVQTRISHRRSEYKNHKSSTSSSMMQYLQRQSARMLDLQDMLHESQQLQNRSNTVEYMQLLSEIVLKAEYSLDSNRVLFEDEDDEGDDGEYGCDDYEEYEIEAMRDQLDEFEEMEEFEERVGKKVGSGKGRKTGGSWELTRSKAVK